MKILIADAFSKNLPDKLKSFGEVTENLNDLPEADIVLIRSKTEANKEYLDRAETLKMIIRGGVGIDNIDVDYCKQKGIIVKNTPTTSSVAVAELVFAHLLSLKRHIVRAHTTTKAKGWEKKKLKGTELYKKTIGLVGLGRIGIEVAKRAKAFGMEVMAYDPYVKESDLAKMVSFDELLAKSDIISLHIPATKETEDIINEDTIAKMKDGVIIVNTARGSLIDEEALCEALQSGKVKAAAIDVYKNEPPEGSKLLEADNVLLTPHLGASTHENMERIEDIIVEQVGEFLLSKPR